MGGPGGVERDAEIALDLDQVWTRLGAHVIEKCDRRAIARVEEEMQEIVVAVLTAPSARGDGMDELEPEPVAVELHRRLRLPGWEGGVVHAVKLDWWLVVGHRDLRFDNCVEF